MQQALIHNSQWIFAKELNALLMDGWRVVPGTQYAAGLQQVYDGSTRADRVRPDGTTFRMFYFVVLEKEDAR